MDKKINYTGLEIAVIGMAARFPGAKNIDQFWTNLKNGIETISFFSKEELEQAGVEPALIDNPDFVKARGGLEDVEYFDPAFFDYTAVEAQLMDPQLRFFHECAWQALENAGYDPENYKGKIGIYAGASPNLFWEASSYMSGSKSMLDPFAVAHLIFRDYMTTRVSYKLNLRGPSFLVQAACSTSLVAIHVACQALLSGECAMALAGGVSISLPQAGGYLYQEGMVKAPDGHCRAFDADSKGFCGGNGVGVVVLKPLEDAAAHGDFIQAVIKGSGINNDGKQKTGYTAPSLRAQANLIKATMSLAEVEPENIGYIEAHGTGTPIGDPIEVEALKRAFNTEKRGFCRIGSVKTNIGHLDAAAGAAGFIKTVLALKNRQIPPSLFFNTPNPKIDFENSPFIVNTQLTDWHNENQAPLRAGVSSLGIGGTNAHVILEEWPGSRSLGGNAVPGKPEIIILSGKTAPALERVSGNLVDYFKENPGLNLTDAAYTLQTGRKVLEYKRMAVCTGAAEVVALFSTLPEGKVREFYTKIENRPLIFMFSGQGAQYINMGLDLYRDEPLFKEQMDRGFEILQRLLGHDIKDILYPDPADRQEEGDTSSKLDDVIYSGPIKLVFEYSLTKFLMARGIKPYALIGHSFGEYVAACISGVFSLEDALTMAVLRGKLMEKTPAGAMMSVHLSEEELEPLLVSQAELSLAAVNSPTNCIVSGPVAAVASFQADLTEKGHEFILINFPRASHSKLMAPITAEFEEKIGALTFNKPRIPYISGLTGKWIKNEAAADPSYWARHLVETVRFSDGLKELLKESNSLFLEIGPGRGLTLFLSQQPDRKPGHMSLNLVRHKKEAVSDIYYTLSKIGELWLYGVRVDWPEFYSKTREKRYRIPLPVYPFDANFFAVPKNSFLLSADMLPGKFQAGKKQDIGDWFYLPTWKRTPPILAKTASVPPAEYLLFLDDCGIGRRLAKVLEQKGQKVIGIKPGKKYVRQNEHLFILNLRKKEDYNTLFMELRDSGRIPGTIVHLRTISLKKNNKKKGVNRIERITDSGFHSLIHIAQALGKLAIDDEIRLKVVTNNMQEVVGGDLLCPEKAVVIGPVKGIPMEYPNIHCSSIDICLPDFLKKNVEKSIDLLSDEITGQSGDQVIALRDFFRWGQIFEPLRLEKPGIGIPLLRQEGVYLVTGGTGGVGLVLAQYLAKSVRARLVLTGRSGFPPRDSWGQYLNEHTDENSTSEKIIKIRELEKAGAEVLLCSADVSDSAQMKQAIRRTLERFGNLHGVIHAAGVPDGELMQIRTREKSQTVMTPKIKGTLVLEQVLQGLKLDFFILCSSMSAILAPFAQVAYCSANAFIDAFALYKSGKAAPVISINWDRWQNLGMSRIGARLGEKLTGEKVTGGMTEAEGVEVFSRILANPLPQVAVKYDDLNLLVKQRNIAGKPSHIKELEKLDFSGSPGRRPEISAGYVAPGNKIEQRLTEIFQRFFGFDKVGINDDFFELGGDSLKAITLASHIKKEYPVSLNDLLAGPTVGELASLLREKGISIEPETGSEEDNLLDKLECIERLTRGSNPDKNNIFIIHPLHGMVNQYQELALLLEEDYHVYGIQARGLVPGAKMASSPIVMIDDYLDQVLAVQKGGTYIIAGYCVGNIIGYEIVRRLEKLNYKVKKFIMIDANDFFPGFTVRLLRMMQYFPPVINKAIISLVEKRFQWKKLKLEEVKRRREGAGSSAAAKADEKEFNQEEIEANLGLLTQYILPGGIVQTPLLILRAKENKQPFATEEYFNKLTKSKSRLLEIPGDHDSILEKPQVEKLAEKIKK
ncbi:MAG: SDR family NAD(P)-dependent oxidoreductase [Candidatus Aminicenantes bacterium]|nr:SDR family NAD(P)-dependent oxidoreductase [Candidatus Aminicenantes bacterium]